MPPAAVRVTTPSRLHFGMLSFGQSGVRQFGGVGLMIADPRIRLQITAADRIEANGPLADRAVQFARRVSENLGITHSIGCHIELESAPREHVGLGTGTQLGLAIAAGLCALHSLPPSSPTELARLAGRCQRSSIGTHGFASGGLLFEAGRRAAGEPSPIVARVELPEQWRFLLLVPKSATGLFGEAERAAFVNIPPILPVVTDALAREAVMNLLPSAIEGDFVEFSRSLYRYGTTAGECFADQQYGAFLDRRTAGLAELIRDLGVEGVGQSSWGPTLFAAVPSESAGRELAARLAAATDLGVYDRLVARPDNAGAKIDVRTSGFPA
jgi:beta-ribofuranosylaminobenzene 5'-phosphate synthase